MTFNINEMLGTLQAQDGILMPTDYRVSITMGTADLGNAQSWTQTGNAADQATGKVAGVIAPFLCDAANLPGVSFDTSQIYHSGYGFSENRPIKGSYQNFILSFIADGKADVLKFFQKWLHNIHNMNGAGAGNIYNGMRLYEFAYPEAYESIVNITQYDKTGNAVMTWTIVGAYPKTIQETPVSWRPSEDYLKIAVEMTYNYWYTDALEPGDAIQDNVNVAAPAAGGH